MKIKTEYIITREMEHILAALTPSNALVMRVSLHTGLRVGDVLELRMADLKPRFWICERKTGKAKMVGLPAPLLRELKAQAGEIWVFPGRLDPEKHRTRQAVWADVKRAAKAFRMPENVAPHTARKIYAVELMRKYGDIKSVQKALNHSNPDVTMLYAMADKLVRAKGLDKASRGVV